MNPPMGIRLIAALVLVLSQFAQTEGPHAEGKPIIVFAAASLKNALDDVADHYATATGHRVVVSYAASSMLAKQILAGAPAQVFISADQAWMDHLEKNAAIVPTTRRPLLGNSLVLIAPKDSTVQMSLRPGEDLTPLLEGGRLAVAETSSVPAGKYARAALESFGIWPSLQGKLAQASDVRAALALVGRGEAPLGIVYASDAAAEPAVRIVATFPADSHPEIVYPAALTREAHDEDARAFLAFLSSDTAGAVFARYGFRSLTCVDDCRRSN